MGANRHEQHHPHGSDAVSFPPVDTTNKRVVVVGRSRLSGRARHLREQSVVGHNEVAPFRAMACHVMPCGVMSCQDQGVAFALSNRPADSHAREESNAK